MRLKRHLIATVVLGMVALLSLGATASSKVTVATYSPGRFERLKSDLLPIWQEKYPNIEIEVITYPDFFEKMLVLMATDQAPDIIDTAGTYLFGHVVRGGAVDLAPLIERDPDLNYDALFPALWNEVRWPQPDGGSIYAIPYDTVGGLLWYNKSLVSSAGVSFPDATWTWEDLRDAALRISRDTNGDGTNDVWGMRTALDYTLFDTIVKSYGGMVLAPDRRSAALDSTEAAAATRFLRETIQSGAGSTQASFTDGNVGFQVGGSWMVSSLSDDKGIDWGVAMTPRGPVMRSVYGGSNQWEVIRRPSQDLDATWTILKELVGLEAIETFWSSYNIGYSLPGVRSVAEAVEMSEVQRVLIESVPFMHDADTSPDWNVWQGAKQREIMPVLLGERSAEEGLARATLEIDKILDGAFE